MGRRKQSQLVKTLNALVILLHAMYRKTTCHYEFKFRHHDTQQNDTQHNNILHKDTQHKGLIFDIQHKRHSA
jgi:hypothetical protein